MSAARHWTDNVSWMSSVPSNWEITRVGRVTTHCDRRNDKHDDRLLSLSSYTGISLKHHDDENRVRTGEELAHYWRVEPDQLVVNPMWLNNGSIAVSEMSGVISPDYRVYDLRADVEPSFAHHVFRSPVFWSLYQVLTRGHTTYDRRISKDDFADLPFPLPPRPTQRAIADFLDRKTAAIDDLIAKKERLLGLLAEKRAALIHRAVTKGLDPSVPMKDSGVHWIGMIPAHWQVMRLRRVLCGVEQGWSPQCENRATENGEWGVLKAGCTAGGRFRASEHKALPSGVEPQRELAVRKGDLIMSRASGSPDIVGSVALVEKAPDRLLLSDKLFRLHVDRTRVDPRFMLLALGGRATRVQIEQAISGAEGLANNLPQGRLKELVVVIPPMNEQCAIAGVLSGIGARIRQLERAMRASKERLREYRQALITAAVTGQLDVSRPDADISPTTDTGEAQLGLFGGAA